MSNNRHSRTHLEDLALVSEDSLALKASMTSSDKEVKVKIKILLEIFLKNLRNFSEEISKEVVAQEMLRHR